MKKFVMLLALCVAFSLTALAQYGGSSSSPQGTSSDQTKSSKKAAKGEMGGKEHTVTGCLSGPNEDGLYVLTNGRYKKGLEVGGNDQLKEHVGHEVKLTGTWASESELGAKENATEKKAESKEKAMKVSNIQHLASTCKTSAKGKKEKGGSKSAPPSM